MCRMLSRQDTIHSSHTKGHPPLKYSIFPFQLCSVVKNKLICPLPGETSVFRKAVMSPYYGRLKAFSMYGPDWKKRGSGWIKHRQTDALCVSVCVCYIQMKCEVWVEWNFVGLIYVFSLWTHLSLATGHSSVSETMERGGFTCVFYVYTLSTTVNILYSRNRADTGFLGDVCIVCIM